MIAQRAKRMAIHCLVGDIDPSALREASQLMSHRFPRERAAGLRIVDEIGLNSSNWRRFCDGFPAHDSLFPQFNNNQTIKIR
jgi:hypothetical protein